ncbi:copper resistance protein CopC [Calidifontibacter sp. DB0510]|uniref:Copper resistance protein CopC n=1 Tax=Metallococcus carri TaxID=1656884 RepID=A0A967B4I6_9MICO|nr:copper resistance CopC family protein [Metallococcus carri]NHN55482.1 copper resistance protein CopC [Metallococcus carri]NOP38334.1 copper resistance protein CopC [Calidifontibacter sp. DB2511S]
MRIRSLLALLAAALLPLLVVGMPTASAHDRVASTTPKDGSTVAPPEKIVLSLSDRAQPTGTQLKVTGPQGEVTSGTAIVTGKVVTQALKPGLPNGKYTVVWRVTSSDGHPISGTFAFTVAGATASTSSSATASGSSASNSAGSAASSTSPTPPAQQTPTNSSNNAPAVVIGAVVLAVLLIGGGVLLSRRYLKDDE